MKAFHLEIRHDAENDYYTGTWYQRQEDGNYLPYGIEPQGGSDVFHVLMRYAAFTERKLNEGNIITMQMIKRGEIRMMKL